jgi:Domain of unknown function (DUF1707)/Cell wall-active antibiotics response 4TMS YvqF
MAEISNTGDSLGLRASDTDRERVADRLREAAAQGQITMDELDERLETTYSARTFGELVPVTADLPASSAPAAVPAPARSPAVSRIGGTPGRWRRSVAIMSGASRKGRWVVPAKYHAVAVMGGIELDLREATFAEPVTQINVAVLMGGIEIMVPEGVEVHLDAVAIMGGTDMTQDPSPVYDSGTPVLRVTGVVMMGGVEVSYKPLKKKKDKSSKELSDGDRRELGS